MYNKIINVLKEQISHTDTLYWALGITNVMIIFFYGWYRCKYIKNHKDIFEFSLWKNSNKMGIDGWSLSHYLAFLVFGFLYPNTFILTNSIGILWELFECWVGIVKPKILSGLGFCNPAQSGNNQKIWWYGKPSDFIVNALGFITRNKLNKFLILK